VEDMLVAPGLDHQAYLYYQVKEKLMTYAVRWIIGRQLTMSMVGVPRSQRDLIIQSKDGLYGFVESCLDHVFTQLPISDNYFWTVYLNGYYTVTCCPNYLLPDNFDILRERSNRITLYTTTISQFLQDNPGEYSHFVLLDHQDWLAEHNVKALREEWELILKNSRKGTRILLRSAANKIGFFPDFVMDAVEWETELSKATHFYDRVGTYGSVYLGVVK
jgi:S-adenosylmethionine-diacylglycerol 3-amino-3-carboxypropyl transferase